MDKVVIIRAADQDAQRKTSGGRATAINFAGIGDSGNSWIGTVTLKPGDRTGGHHHGRHEVALYVVKGRARLNWGEKLEEFADVEPGDFAYFPPFIPHGETNLDDQEPVEFLVVRSDDEKIVVPLS